MNKKKSSLFEFIRIPFESIRVESLVLLLLILLGAILRFTNLFWGQPYWFHPDERNIASAVTRLQWPEQMNPEFFAYGTVPIYLNFFTIKAIRTWFDISEDPFSTAIKVGRIWSALLSTALIPLMYWITKRYFKLKTKNQKLKTSLIAAILTTFSFGFIQFAHFGTFEIWLTVLRLLLLITVIEITNKAEWKWIFATGIIFGLAIGTKITSLIFLPGLAVAILWPFFRCLCRDCAKRVRQQSPWIKHPGLLATLSGLLRRSTSRKDTLSILHLLNSGIKFLIIILIAFIVFVVTNPFAFNFDLPSVIKIKQLSDLKLFFNPTFLHSINSEGGIARGNIPVFYTRHFTGTTPYLYQLQKIYPYVLSWPVLILGLIGLLSFGLKIFKKPKNKKYFILHTSYFILHTSYFILHTSYFILLIWFLLQFGFIGSLFVKWTRYTIPTLPYLIFSFSVIAGAVLNLSKGEVSQSGSSKNPNSFTTLFGLSRFPSFFVITSKITLLLYYFVVLLILWHITQGLLFTTIYTQSDPRIKAAQWASQKLSVNTKIMSEVWDLGIIPFNRKFMHNITLFNFYELDNKGTRFKRIKELNQQLKNTNTIIILGRRIWKHSTDLPQLYPEAAEFYNKLFLGKLGFIKTAEFYNQPRFGPFRFNSEIKAEETFSVFDHPHIQIWQRRSKQ